MEVAVDAGTEPSSASASFVLSVPIHHRQSFARDAQFLLRPGLEVHIYFRGYFPVKGLFSPLAEPQVSSTIRTPGSLKTTTVAKDRPDPTSVAPPNFNRDAKGNAALTRGDIAGWAQDLGVSEDQLMVAIVMSSETTAYSKDAPYVIHSLYNRKASDAFPDDMWDIACGGTTTTGKQSGRIREYASGRPPTGESLKDSLALIDKTLGQRASGDIGSGVTSFYHTRAQNANAIKDPVHNRNSNDLKQKWAKEGKTPLSKDSSNMQQFSEGTIDVSAASAQAVAELTPQTETVVTETVSEEDLSNQKTVQDSMLSQLGLGAYGLEDVLAYPYYNVFHGVVTQVGHSYSGGVQSISVQCQSILHFWSYHRISTNASHFGARPRNSKLRTSLIGHNLTGMHPYQIVYTMHHDVAGAAAGVAWQLSRKTNQSASFGGESLFSLNVRYWERRFNSRMAKLRMHGATGELFSTAQAAFLGTTSSSTLTKALRLRFLGTTSRKKHVRTAYSRMMQLGLGTARKRDALFEIKSKGPGKGGMEINQIEMQGFTLDIGNIGQLQMFESTYESKMELVQRVCEITGFEFYQDVDGDFVYKPPFYNLDTSGSRVYRIEDIDIISINLSEQEPEATYVTCKGSHWKNLGGMGMDNEWGVGGQFIDYRLVAQFGWRGQDMETAYLNDSKAMFFAAVNRLDILNAGMHTVSITIPERPELRPGYPVYIAYLDCFYYCNSFAHSHSVGGQCTTSIEGVAKRAKFYAPGLVGKESRGIDAIRMNDTTRPQRPLEVRDSKGNPMLSGFPNVVMALDPDEINPLFFLVGTDVDRLEDPQVLNNLLKKGLQLHVLQWDEASKQFVLPLSGSESPKGTQIKVVRFSLQNASLGDVKKDWRYKSTEKGAVTVATVDIMAAALERKKRVAQYGAKRAVTANKIAALRGEIAALEAQKKDLRDTPEDKKREADIDAKIEGFGKSKIPKDALGSANKKDKTARAKVLRKGLQGSLDALMAAQAQETTKLAGGLTPSKQDAVGWLQLLLDTIGEEYGASRSQGDADYANMESTVNLLDLLSDKKAVFTNGQQPGYYRYYSASHPYKEQQGQKKLTLKASDEASGAKGSVKKESPVIESQVWANQEVLGFLKTVPIPAGGTKPEAALGQMQPEWGIRVYTSNPAFPAGEVIPTSEVRELMFATHTAEMRKRATNTRRIGATHPPASATKQAMKSKGNPKAAKVSSPDSEKSIENVYKAEWAVWVSSMKMGFTTAKSTAGPQISLVPAITYPTWPTHVQIRGKSIDVMDKQWTTALAKMAPAQFFEQAGKALGKKYYQLYRSARNTWAIAVAAAFKKAEKVEVGSQVVSVFDSFNTTTSGSRTKRKGRVKSTKSGKLKVQFESPVFPVSDAKGYEVYGTYRYGRDIDIDPDGVFDVVHKQDPLRYLDKKTVEDALNLFIKKRPIMIRRKIPGKKTKTGQPVYTAHSAGGSEAASYLEAEILKQLRQHLTDDQIIDLGLVGSTADPTMLEMNMMNWFTDKSKDATQKTPLVNAGYSLADLKGHQSSTKVCACKVAEADVILAASGVADFVQFTEGNVDATVDPKDTDQITQLLVSEVSRRRGPWKLTQDALRGQVLDRGGSSVVSTALGFREGAAFEQAKLQFQAGVEQIEAAGQAVQDQADVVTSQFDEEDNS